MLITQINNRNVVLSAIYINHSLLFALKSISGDSENDIIKYFYELGIQLFNDVIRRKKMAGRCNRIVKTFYKNTNLQVRFEVKSDYFNSSFVIDGRDIRLSMDATFPRDSMFISGADITAMITETGLGINDEQVVTVNKPQEKVYRCMIKK